MNPILKLAAACGLLALMVSAGAGADYALNDGRILYRLMGRDALAEACLPELKKGLADSGFAPSDLEFSARPSIALGRMRTFGSQFTFQDGAAETRIDGIAACAVTASGVYVTFKTNARPLRAG